MNCQGKKPLIIYGVLIGLQVCFVVVLLVFAARGKGYMDDSEKGSDIPYYVGAIIVGVVYGCLALSSLLLVLFYAFGVEKGSGVIQCTLCVFVYLGLPAFILGIIFISAFGLANCKKNENTSYDMNGFCSYDTNIDNNYNTAVVCLVMTICLFLTNLVHVYLLCKYGGELEDDEIYIAGGPASGSSAGGSATQSSVNTARSSGSKGGNRTLRMMVRDRKIRNDEQRQRRMGVPEHKIIKKFIPRY